MDERERPEPFLYSGEKNDDKKKEVFMKSEIPGEECVSLFRWKTPAVPYYSIHQRWPIVILNKTNTLHHITDWWMKGCPSHRNIYGFKFLFWMMWHVYSFAKKVQRHFLFVCFVVFFTKISVAKYLGSSIIQQKWNTTAEGFCILSNRFWWWFASVYNQFIAFPFEVFLRVSTFVKQWSPQFYSDWLIFFFLQKGLGRFRGN